jgi:hypothetical protein
MKKFFPLFILIFVASGCASYKFQKGVSPYDSGYVVSRDKRVIPEYTIGPNNSVAQDMDLAHERFKRRRRTVERYYKKMGYIESRAKEILWNPPALLIEFFSGLIRLPAVSSRDHRYENDEAYRKEVDRKDEEEFAYEKERRKQLKEELNLYIQKDLEKEGFAPAKAQEVIEPAKIEPKQQEAPAELNEQETKVQVQESASLAAEQQASLPAAELAAPVAVAESQVKETQVVPEAPKEDKPAPVKKEPKKAPVVKKKERQILLPVAVITAAPLKGYSPLTVSFSSTKSYSKNARITGYEWDFGDGDTSKKAGAKNTYWSSTYGSKIFNARLTITDSNGNSAVSSVAIEVMTK